MHERPSLLIVAGPTGVGKTAAAVALARRVPIEVVSADSRQVYRGMDVATGKPTPAEQRAVRHHLIDVVEPDERYHAARFRAEAAAAIGDIRARGRVPVIVGGTGLYVRALLRGLDPAPPADPAFREELAAVAATRGRGALHARLHAEAPALACRLHPNDTVRVVRALERLRAGGGTAARQERWQREDGPYAPIYVGLTMDRAALAARLRARAQAMVERGLLDEVRALLARGLDPALPSMHGIGYREFVPVARGQATVAAAQALMQRDTLRYAKRQWTWFAREPGIAWIDVERAGGAEGVATVLEARLAQGGHSG